MPLTPWRGADHHRGVDPRPSDEATSGGRLPSGAARTGSRRRQWVRLALAAVMLAVVVAVILRVPSAASEFVSAFGHFRSDRLPWLVAAAVLETASLACAALAQRRLLKAGGVRIPFAELLALTVASTAVVDLIPAGIAAASGWLVEQYHLRSAPIPLAVWTVLATGFAATVTALGLLLSGAWVAGVWTTLGLAISATVLAVGSCAFVFVAHRLPRFEGRLEGRLHNKVVTTVIQVLERVAEYRISVPGGATVLAFSVANWLLDAGCLVMAFMLVGFAVPWQSLLFAYAASQVAGGFSFLPAGIGAVEGSMVGAFVLTGTPAAVALVATLIYRVIAYWMVAGVGAAIFVMLTRRQARSRERAAAHSPTEPSRLRAP